MLTALILPQSVSAFYIGTGIGTSNIKASDVYFDETLLDYTISFTSDTSYTIALGTEIPIILFDVRGEVEYAHLKSEKDEQGNVSTYGAMANIYVDLPILPILQPYIGVGVGYMKQKFDFEGNDIVSDWQLMSQYLAGVDLDLPILPFAGGVEYRYMGSDLREKYTSDTYHTRIHAFMLKLRYQF